MASTALATPSARERILETASSLFYAEGLRAVGVDTIIARAGVAKASFYRHFPSKDDLIVAFLERRDTLWRSWLKATVEQLSPAPEGRPLAVFDALAQRFALADYRGCAFINSIVELANRNHAAHHAATDHKRRVTTYLGELLTRAGIRKPDELAYRFMMLIDGAIVTTLRDGTPYPASAAREIAATMLAQSRHSPPRRRKAVTKRS